MTGTVTKVQNKSRNRKSLSYAFVTDSEGKEYFFRLRECNFEVVLGMTVSFEGERNEKGNLAKEIHLLS